MLEVQHSKGITLYSLFYFCLQVLSNKFNFHHLLMMFYSSPPIFIPVLVVVVLFFHHCCILFFLCFSSRDWNQFLNIFTKVWNWVIVSPSVPEHPREPDLAMWPNQVYYWLHSPIQRGPLFGHYSTLGSDWLASLLLYIPSCHSQF